MRICYRLGVKSGGKRLKGRYVVNPSLSKATQTQLLALYLQIWDQEIYAEGVLI